MKNIKIKNNKGFTLLEVLLAVVTLGILVGVIVIVINPSNQSSETRNAQRQEDINTILNGVYQYTIDNNGIVPSSITSKSLEICITGGSCAGLVDLSVLTSGGKYLPTLPVEPQKTNLNGIGYMIKKAEKGRITVEAQFEEQGTVISITR